MVSGVSLSANSSSALYFYDSSTTKTSSTTNSTSKTSFYTSNDEDVDTLVITDDSTNNNSSSNANIVVAGRTTTAQFLSLTSNTTTASLASMAKTDTTPITKDASLGFSVDDIRNMGQWAQSVCDDWDVDQNPNNMYHALDYIYAQVAAKYGVTGTDNSGNSASSVLASFWTLLNQNNTRGLTSDTVLSWSDIRDGVNAYISSGNTDNESEAIDLWAENFLNSNGLRTSSSNIEIVSNLVEVLKNSSIESTASTTKTDTDTITKDTSLGFSTDDIRNMGQWSQSVCDDWDVDQNPNNMFHALDFTYAQVAAKYGVTGTDDEGNSASSVLASFWTVLNQNGSRGLTDDTVLSWSNIRDDLNDYVSSGKANNQDDAMELWAEEFLTDNGLDTNSSNINAVKNLIEVFKNSSTEA